MFLIRDLPGGVARSNNAPWINAELKKTLLPTGMFLTLPVDHQLETPPFSATSMISS